MVRWEALFQKLMMDHVLPKEEVVLLIKVVNKFFQSEPNLIYLNDPVTIVGDIHGYYFFPLYFLNINFIALSTINYQTILRFERNL